MDIDEAPAGAAFDCVLETTTEFRGLSGDVVGTVGIRFLTRIDIGSGRGISQKANWWDRASKDNFEGSTNAWATLQKDADGHFTKEMNRSVQIELTEELNLAYVDFRKVLFEHELAKANSGDVGAMVQMGFYYEYGVDVPVDLEESLRWYKKAAAAGSVGAMSAIAAYHERKQAYKEAFEWHSKAAEKGYPFALFRLGVFYEKGFHVQKSGDRAGQLYEEAANAGSAQAMQHLAVLYALGEIFPKNDIQAYVWASLAAAKDKQFAKLRDSLEQRLSKEQITEAQRISLEWSKQHQK